MDNLVTFKVFKDAFKNYQTSVPKIDDTELRILWMDDYWDGMLEGMLEYKNNKFRFQIITDYKEDSRPRIFAIIQLSERQIDDATEWNTLFKKYVGNHMNLDSDEDLQQHPQTMHHFFYDKYKQRSRPDYDLNIVKGWFVQ